MSTVRKSKNMRVVNADNIGQVKRLMRQIGADKRGVDIMAPKGVLRLIRLRNVTTPVANLLKQEMLSVGGDVCLNRDTISGKVQATDCLITGTLSQYQRLFRKFTYQPADWKAVSGRISLGLKNYQCWKKTRTQIMGIVNVTPDSFSGDGLLAKGSTAGEIIEYAHQLVVQGADIIDVGGESSRPGSRPVSVSEELKRTTPVIKRLSKVIRVPISIDTCKPAVAQRAVDAGASIINDITGLRKPQMLKVAARSGARVIIMHMKGNPRDMQRRPEYKCLLDEVIDYLQAALNRAQAAGINKKRIIVDPGIGFGKTVEHNLEILRNLGELKILGCPILVGPSRKSFIGKILKLSSQERLSGTLASLVVAVMNGAGIVRVHDVRAAAQAVRIADAIVKL